MTQFKNLSEEMDSFRTLLRESTPEAAETLAKLVKDLQNQGGWR